MVDCMYCDKSYSSKQRLNNHINGINRCSFERMKKEHDKEVNRLNEKIEELTQQLINKPTTINNTNIEKIECTINVDDYFKSIKGFHLTQQSIENSNKDQKKIDNILTNSLFNNLKCFSYYWLLTSLCGKNEILDSIVIRDLRRGIITIKFMNLVDECNKNKHHRELQYELSLVYKYIQKRISELDFTKLKYLKSHDYYMDKLRLDLKKNGKNKRIWNDIKGNMLTNNKIECIE